MKKIYLLLGFVLLLPLLSFGQSQERIIDFPKVPETRSLKRTGTEQPVATDEKALALVEITVNGKAVLPEKAFSAGDDWLKSLTIKLKNVSDKPVSSILVSFQIPKTETGNNASLGLVFRHNQTKINPTTKEKLVMPDEIIELSMTEKEYDIAKGVWLQKTGKTVFNQIILGSVVAMFEDGSSITTIKPPRAQ